jgi:hypothetical protein
LKEIFTIGGKTDKSKSLLVQLGQDHCCLGYLDETGKSFEQISYYQLDELEGLDNISRLFDDLGRDSFEKVVICFAYTQALLLPQQFEGDHVSLTDIVYDAMDHVHLEDRIPEWQMAAAYAIPWELHKLVTGKFNQPVFFHTYTPALRKGNGYAAGDQIDIQFSPLFFRVLVKKEQKIQLMQTYSYKTPLDVVYYLLKICLEFGLNQTNTFLVISGLIDRDSALCEELNHYFLNLQFAIAPDYSLPESDHPQYYFTPIYNLAACVS